MIENCFLSIVILPFFGLGAHNTHIIRGQVLLVGPLFELRFPCSFAIEQDQFLCRDARKK